MKLRAGIYLRVSTFEQVKEGYSLQAQEERLTNFALAKDYNLVAKYIDPGHSGAKLDRPGLQSMIEDIKNNKLDIILVYKLDRLSRSQKHTLYLIEDVFLKNNVNFVSMSESFDTTSSFGRAMIGILSVFAQLERDTITERLTMGRVERAKTGLYHGGGNFTPLGYDYIDHMLIVNEFEAMVVKEIYSLYLQNKGVRQIVMELHDKYPEQVTTRTKIKGVLSNPLYIGKVTFAGEIHDGQHESIVDEETFNAAQKIRDSRILYNYSGHEQKGLLNGKLYCGKCGAKYYRQVTGSKKYRYIKYACSSKNWSSPKLIKDRKCDNNRYNVEQLENRVIERLKKLTLKDLTVPEKNGDIEKKSTIKKEIKSIDNQIEKLIELFQFGSITPEKINGRIEKLNVQKINLDLLLNEIDYKKDEKVIQESLKNLNDFNWEEENTLAKIKIMDTFVDTITVNGEQLDIVWNL